MADIYLIPAHDALKALAHEKSASSDEGGEYFAMAIAARTPSAQLHADSVILVPLIPPDEGVEADMSFLAASPFIFLRLEGVPQPLLSYGSCCALSQGAEEFDIPFGSLFKFPSVSHYVVARPSVVANLERLQLQTEPISDTQGSGEQNSKAKKQCLRSLETGGEYF